MQLEAPMSSPILGLMSGQCAGQCYAQFAHVPSRLPLCRGQTAPSSQNQDPGFPTSTIYSSVSRDLSNRRVHEVTMAAPSPSPHKPRRKGKKTGNGSSPDRAVRPVQETLVRAPSFPLAAFMWPARTSSSQWEILPLILMVAGLFRWAAGLWGYSGQHGRPHLGSAWN